MDPIITNALVCMWIPILWLLAKDAKRDGHTLLAGLWAIALMVMFVASGLLLSLATYRALFA